jgi:hypothetical protein
MYTKGAIYNIELAKEIYPGWVCRFYTDSSVRQEVIKEIETNGGQVIKINDNRGNNWGMFWRFLANDDPDMEIFISRDCDSRLSPRERGAVKEWEESDKGLHIMHDHYAHRAVPILGGMWGAKKGCITNIEDKINKWGNYGNKGIDQTFLWNSIWPLVQGNMISHGGAGACRWGDYRPFPEHGPSKYGGIFVGQVFDENNRAIIP